MLELISLFWIADILNLPFMAMFDTTYPLNGIFWVMGWMMISAIHAGRQK